MMTLSNQFGKYFHIFYTLLFKTAVENFIKIYNIPIFTEIQL